uniref:WD_REPEATS_REGION domain-containing protein n=2 Tax=Bursaphelenchus xylophilus TaxID=6326 RepID=A0A1I7SH80_BURXY
MTLSSPTKVREIRRDAEFVDEFAAISHFKRKNRVRPYEGRYANYVRSVSWNCDGTMLAGGNYDSSHSHVVVGQMDPSTNRLRHQFLGSGHDDFVNEVAFSPVDPFIVASCSSDRSVRVWDVRVTKTHHRCVTSDGNTALTWSPDGKNIVFIDKSDRLHVIDRANLDVKARYEFKEKIYDVTFHPSQKFLIVCGTAGKIDILRFPELTHYRTIQAHPPLSDCLAAEISPNGQYLAIGASDASCSIWDLEDMICVRTLSRMDYPVRSVSFSHCSNLVASGSEDYTIDISWAEKNIR